MLPTNPRGGKLAKPRDGWRHEIMRILVVDDFEPWRRFVSSLLRREPARHVVFEAAEKRPIHLLYTQR